MNVIGRVAIVMALAVAVGIVIQNKRASTQPTCCPPLASVAGSANAATASAEPGLPRLIEFGGSSCPPCKAMVPILEQLAEEYKGRLIVETINIKTDPQAGKAYGVQIPGTLVLFDENGVEVDRHMGFKSKEDILEWADRMAIDLAGPASNAEADSATDTGAL